MMKLKNLFLSLMALLLVVSAAAQNIRSYESHGGIWFEKFETDTNLFIYSSDNTIYIPHQQRTFTYSYQKNSVQYLFQSTGEKNWKLVPINEATDSAAVTIIMQIIADSATLGYGSAHSGKTGQSILHRSFYNKFSKRLPVQEYTGLVENERNIWFHPPRTFLFEMLELNPFPYIKFPIKKNRVWRWKLTIGSQWGDARWKEWEGAIVNHYKYRITNINRPVTTALGTMNCTVVESRAKSRIGTTQATFYFEEKLGFVKYEYMNIDGSSLMIELVEINVNQPTR